MIDLQESDVNGLNSGSFQDIFNATAAEIGSEVRSGQMALQDAEASKDEARHWKMKELEYHWMKRLLLLFSFNKHFLQMLE